MNKLNKLTIIFIAVLLLTLPLLAACSDDDDDDETAATVAPTDEPTAPVTELTAPVTEPFEDVKITIGNLSDMTGPASNSLILVNSAMDDLVRYFNDENMIPGVELDIEHYDGQYNPANDKPGYEWLKDKGADLIFAGLPNTPVTLKSFMEEDEMLLFSLTAAQEVIDPPGWVFATNAPTAAYAKTLLKWIAENDWDWETNGPAKVGGAGWVGSYWQELGEGAEQYCDEHPEQFTWIGAQLNQYQQMWDTEVAALKDADYVFPPGAGMMSFIPAYRNSGATAKFIGNDSHAPFFNYAAQAAGWDALDGWIFALPNRWWNEDAEIPNLAADLIEAYHPGKYEEFKGGGSSYIGPIGQLYGPLLILKETIERVGAENFTSQAFYETATSFSYTYGESEEWNYTDTKRTPWNSLGIYELSAADMDLVRADPEWQPVIY
ncbi:ABC transporter substrate-binding protein [Chloroflexota bacterium]